jgi:hypothetical protein
MPGPPVTLRVSLKTNAAFRLVALALGCALPGHVDVSAQQGQTASIEGRVTDVSGAVLGGARVTAASPQMIGGVPMTETAPDGRYRLSSLLPGTYEIAVTHQGFKTLLYSDIELSPGIGLTLDVRLEVAPVSETVHVRSAAPVIDVRSSSVPTVIDRNFIDNLPLDSTNQVGGPSYAIDSGSSQAWSTSRTRGGQPRSPACHEHRMSPPCRPKSPNCWRR